MNLPSKSETNKETSLVFLPSQKRKVLTIPDPYSLKSDWTLPTSFGLTARLVFVCLFVFFLEINTFLFFDVCVVFLFPWLPCVAFTCRPFGGFRWRCCDKANIAGTGFNLIRPGPPSKWTEHIPVCLITFKLSRRQAAIHHRIRRSRSDIPTV